MKKIKYVFFGFIIVMLIYFMKLELGSLTDWISAFANIAMAFIAWNGFLIAKNWKRDATQELAISRCLTILSTTLPNIQKNMLFTLFENTLKHWLDSLKSTNIVGFDRIQFIHGIAKSFSSTNNISSTCYTDLVSEYGNLCHLSWKVKDAKKDSFFKIITDVKAINSKQVELVTLLQIIFGYWGVTITDIETKKYDMLTWDLSKNEIVIKALEVAIEIIRLKEDLAKGLEDFNVKDSSIFDVFESNH